MKLRIALSTALLASPVLLAQLSVPKLGVARYPDHTVRGIDGLESNILVGDKSLYSADAVSFSDLGGLISSAGRIQLISAQGAILAELNTNEAAPVLNIDNALATAIAWLPSRSVLAWWNGSSFVETPVNRADVPGSVTSVQLVSPTLARLLVTDARGNVFEANVSLSTGAVASVDLLPGIKGSAFLQQGFLVSEGQNGLDVQAPNGSVRTLPLSASALVFERMSSDWVHIASPATHQDWALHLTDKALQLSILPAPSMAGGSQLRQDKEVAK